MTTVNGGPQRTTQGEWQARWDTIRRAPRVVVFAVLIVAVFIAFGRRLWYLQFVEGDYYIALADTLRLKAEDLPAARGIIYARDGTPLVQNVPTFKVVVIPAYLPDYDVDILPPPSADAEDVVQVTFSEEAEAVLVRLAVLLSMPYSTNGGEGEEPGVREIVVDAIARADLYGSAVIKRGVDRETALLIGSERLTLPGVFVELDSQRQYPQGELVSQMVGYVSPIPGERKDEYVELGYDPDTDRIGVAGVEATYEDALRGIKGSRLVEKDVLGRVIRVVETEAEPIPGGNVYLTLDLDLQRFTTDALRRGMVRANSPRGAAIVMRPKTGEILSMVSLPTYDNNLFAKGISVEDWQRLGEDDHRPLLNHAISDQVPPGSVFKIVLATAALQEGVVDADTRLDCQGTIVLPDKYAPNDRGRDETFYCWIWRQGGHGSLNLVEALVNSCDIYFYKVGGGFEEDDFEGLGPGSLESDDDPGIANYAALFGFGEPTGIELTGEAAGTVPYPTWKRRTHGENWSTGDTYNYSIGQGYLAVTPLQMLDAVNVVANGGVLVGPQIVHHVTDYEGNVIDPFEPEVVRTLSAISPTYWSLIQQGMEGAVARGTAKLAQVEGVRVAGKTGTAQFCDDLYCGVGFAQPEHAWFTAFAPVGDPEISVIIFLYKGGEGSQMAVPVAQEILEYYLSRGEAVP
jgi:penicillin-binding protein 2